MVNSHSAADLLVDLQRGNGRVLHRQIEASIREGIRTGRLVCGSSLPPTRVLAAELRVSRGVVVEAYEQLVAEGYLVSRSGGYTQVAAGPAPRSADRSAPAPARPAVDFGYGRADVASFPRAAWLRSFRRVLTEVPNDRFNYQTGSGLPELRAALAEYLNRVRGTSAHPDDVVICTGYAQGISLLVHVLAAAGAGRLAVEDPSSDDDVRPSAAAAGMQVVGIPVAEDGIRIDALERTRADVLVLTPSHQWPIGGVLSPEARAAVLRWARDRDALIIEDDYDAEYRYDRAPVGAMQGLAPDLVVYAGTASKTLAPGIRLGWLVVPERLRHAVAAAKIGADRGSSAFDQLTFTDFLTHGEFDRHLRRMRPVYRRRRDALLAALGDHLPQLRPVGAAAGTHLVAWLPDSWEEDALVDAARRGGVGISGVSPYRLTAPGPGGLLFGYANLGERVIEEGVRRLAAAVAGLGDGR